MRNILIPAVVAGLLALLTCSQAHAWAAYHRSYTSYNPYSGVHHYGETESSSRYGSAYHSSSYSPYSGYHSSSYSRSYSPSMYGSYSTVGHTSYYGNGSAVHSTTVYP